MLTRPLFFSLLFFCSGIGEWNNAIKQATILGTVTAIGLVCMGTGHLEWWLHPDCILATNLAYGAIDLMTPDLTCFESWGWRLAASVLLFLAVWLLINEIESFIAPVAAETLRAQHVKQVCRLCGSVGLWAAAKQFPNHHQQTMA